MKKLRGVFICFAMASQYLVAMGIDLSMTVKVQELLKYSQQGFVQTDEDKIERVMALGENVTRHHLKLYFARCNRDQVQIARYTELFNR
jgi:shikimate kinase